VCNHRSVAGPSELPRHASSGSARVIPPPVFFSGPRIPLERGASEWVSLFRRPKWHRAIPSQRMASKFRPDRTTRAVKRTKLLMDLMPRQRHYDGLRKTDLPLAGAIWRKRRYLIGLIYRRRFNTAMPFEGKKAAPRLAAFFISSHGLVGRQQTASRDRFILFVSAAHYDLQSIIGQRPLQGFRLIPRRA
jgi:hypothetical protein